MANSDGASSGNKTLTVNLLILTLSLLALGFFTRSCHASSSWDNVNIFSPGFLKAGDVDETVTKYEALAQGTQDPTRLCDAYTKIADAYARLEYEHGLEKSYREKAEGYCKPPPPPEPAEVAAPGVGARQRMAKAVFTVAHARKSAGAALANDPQCGQATSNALGALLPIVTLRQHLDLPGATELLAARESAVDCLVCAPGLSYAEHCDAAAKQAQAAIAEIDKSLPAGARLGPKWLESDSDDN